MEQTARDVFEAREAGSLWNACAGYCHDGASFSCPADALADTTPLKNDAAWMKGLPGPVPDRRHDFAAFAADVEHGTVVASNYACVLRFDGDRTGHVAKIWNDRQALRQLVWA